MPMPNPDEKRPILTLAGGTDYTTRIVTAREEQYGRFHVNSVVSQSLKKAIKIVARDWDALPPDVRESLDMICTKISRAVNGAQDHIDTWDDIAGYARLISDRLRNDEAKKIQPGE